MASTVHQLMQAGFNQHGDCPATKKRAGAYVLLMYSFELLNLSFALMNLARAIREHMKDRVNALAARTTTVHGSLDIEISGKSIGTSLVRLGLSRGEIAVRARALFLHLCRVFMAVVTSSLEP